MVDSTNTSVRAYSTPMMRLLALLWLLCGLSACLQQPTDTTSTTPASTPKPAPSAETTTPEPTTMAIATFANGCFWCTEAVFEQLRGVTQVTSGYIGGQVDHPTYKDVCNGTTGHAEALQITYDPAQISFETLLEVFWKTHDPTTLNRQGNDVGTQYRSAIFYTTPEQRITAELVKARVAESGLWKRPITTEIAPEATWWTAEGEHQNFLQKNPYGYTCHYML